MIDRPLARRPGPVPKKRALIATIAPNTSPSGTPRKYWNSRMITRPVSASPVAAAYRSMVLVHPRDVMRFPVRSSMQIRGVAENRCSPGPTVTLLLAYTA